MLFRDDEQDQAEAEASGNQARLHPRALDQVRARREEVFHRFAMSGRHANMLEVIISVFVVVDMCGVFRFSNSFV